LNLCVVGVYKKVIEFKEDNNVASVSKESPSGGLNSRWKVRG
jgi:hypothetical protein